MAGPSDFDQLSARARFERSFTYKPAANANTGYHKVPNRTPPPPPPFEPQKPQKISENSYTRQQRWDSGFTSGRALNDNPGFRNPNPISATRLGMPPVEGVRMPLRMPRISGGSLAGAGISAIPILIDAIRDPKSLTRNSYEDVRRDAERTLSSYPPIPPGFTYDPDKGTASPNPLDPRLWNPFNPFNPFNSRKFSPIDVGKPDPNRNAPTNQDLPEWLNPFKDTSKNGDRIPENQGPPNSESTRWFPAGNKIKFWSPNNRGYREPTVLSYSIKEVPKNRYPDGRGGFYYSARFSSFTYLREGTDDYLITINYRNTGESLVRSFTFNIEPWTLQNLGPDPFDQAANPSEPELIVPETNQPFFPPLPDYLDELARGTPPTILDPNDFKPPGKNQPLTPIFPPELAPIPKPLDPLQKPEQPILPGTQPPKPDKDEETKIPPLFPFNPFPSPPSPTQNPPPFEPGPPNSKQRLNDRGIFPARKADITSSASGSPLSPDREIGGDPVRLVPPPTITKPKPPFETDREEQERKKREEEKKKSLFPLPIAPLIPPVFPRPVGPTGTIDPNTADDITKSKDPPKPPVGTKPKCQDACMAGLQSGQEAILDKLGTGVNTASNLTNLALLPIINSKLGDQLTGGLAGKLTRFSKWMQFDRIMNVFILIGVLHNAAMLSRSAAETIGELTSQALTVIGIKGDDDQPINVNEIIGKQANTFMSSILGETVWNGTKESWQKANRIISTASNIISTVRSITDSTRDVMEWTAENTGKIGNALKRWRVVGENAYKWMPERVTAQGRWHKGIDRAVQGIQSVEDTASSLAGAVGNVRSIQEDFTEVKEQKENFDKALKESTPKSGTENDATKAKATAEKAASASPVLAVTDRAKGDTP